MPKFCYTLQYSHDRGETWRPSSVFRTAGTEFLRPDAAELDAAELAADVLDTAYRAHLEHDEPGPLPVIQVLVWEGDEPHGVPAATSSTGVDAQWQTTAELLAEIAADIRAFELERKQHEQAAASAQRAAANAKDRLARVVVSAARMKMPQGVIARSAGRSREWVRQTVG